MLQSLPQEQAAKTNMASMVRIQVFKYLVLCTVEDDVVHMTDYSHEAGIAWKNTTIAV